MELKHFLLINQAKTFHNYHHEYFQQFWILELLKKTLLLLDGMMQVKEMPTLLEFTHNQW
ncbi:MAG: hypothetical protein CMK81_03115 [Pseudomonadales bacterium]|nr:hypothetical protein [Pseudomonadales bacterium]